jgi:hypothetical protein
MFKLESSALPLESYTRLSSKGVNLFVSGENPTFFFKADPQAKSSSSAPLPYQSALIEDPIPENLYLYIFKGAVRFPTLTEKTSLFYLEKNCYFIDLLTNFTYLVVDKTETSFLGTLDLEYNYSEFVEVLEDDYFNLTFSFVDSIYSFSDISSVESGGFAFSKQNSEALGDSEFYYDVNSKNLTIQSSYAFGATENQSLLLKLDIDFTSYAERFDVWSFTYPSDLNIDFIDYLQYSNKSFYSSTSITSGSLLFNRLSKIALCLH